MLIFVCHSDRDRVPTRSLAQSLQQAQLDVWLDDASSGGYEWWARVLEGIRSCDVFVVALSNNVLVSKPCRAQMDYARTLGLPALPVQIGEVDSYRTAYGPGVSGFSFTMQVLDFRQPDAASAMVLISALHNLAAQRPPLPTPLPEPPPVPYEYLQRLVEIVHSRESLSAPEQVTLLLELSRALQEDGDDSIRDDIRVLLRTLRDRPDVSYAVVSKVDHLLAASR